MTGILTIMNEMKVNWSTSAGNQPKQDTSRIRVALSGWWIPTTSYMPAWTHVGFSPPGSGAIGGACNGGGYGAVNAADGICGNAGESAVYMR
ncbi:hypothetical protein PV327_001351 [Microctonus hyperodae]|uniref:Uncharacterized protein n=1 Tax=Microctonus hyperodae TaxID=165561 RepID=A0AA39G8E2_MICHY|nr:hypothetical protein PV327_001351 [Microctonus hyperodae]